MTMPPAQGAYTCPYCRMASDGGGGTCPALRRAGRRPAQGLRLRLDRAAADPGHGPHQVRAVHLPGQRHVRAGGRDGAARRRLGLLLPSCAAAHRPEHPLRQPAPEGRLEADAGRDAADHDDGAGPRAHRVQRRRAGGDPGRAARPWPGRRRGRAPLPRGHRERQLRLAAVQPLVHHPGRRRRGMALPAGQDPGHSSPRRAATACCCCTPRATRSSATWRLASASWCSRAG